MVERDRLPYHPVGGSLLFDRRELRAWMGAMRINSARVSASSAKGTMFRMLWLIRSLGFRRFLHGWLALFAIRQLLKRRQRLAAYAR
jgi:hypothetical protein